MSAQGDGRREQHEGRDLPRWAGLLVAGLVLMALSWSAADKQSPGLALLLGLLGGPMLLIGCIACGVQLGIEAARDAASRR